MQTPASNAPVMERDMHRLFHCTLLLVACAGLLGTQIEGAKTPLTPGTGEEARIRMAPETRDAFQQRATRAVRICTGPRS